MKKHIFISKLLISCLTLSASLLLADQVFATSADTQEKIITESTQKLSQLKDTKQKYSEQKNENTITLTDLNKEIQDTQQSLEQLEKFDLVGKVSERSEKNINTTESLLSGLPVTLSNSQQSSNPITDIKEKLTDLKQQHRSLLEETTEISTNQKSLQQEEVQLSEKIAEAKQQKSEQTKQMDTRSAVVAAAKTHLGNPYVYGAAGPDSFDCSGLVQVAFAAIGHPVGRTTINQESAGTTISVAEAQAGDLVFWGSHGGTYHVGISTGDGSYIHAPVPGDVVQIATVASYSPDFAVRVL
ncbi:C40 family peptidase [Enterococcus sp. 5H]|uniref:C40 family peptidase n=1 Tax=Enterococcus sp. 5H TaxID=1229490 RepID=UPI0023030F59|nr:NlpC/P60 family protein [Enterococcus sp. 5H]MDA9471453.1 Cell wall-associated hydrolase [Enterococcus sp. 5H]